MIHRGAAAGHKQPSDLFRYQTRRSLSRDFFARGEAALGDGYLYLVILAVMLVLGFVYYYRVMMVNLPQIVREVLKMEGKKRDDIPRK